MPQINCTHTLRRFPDLPHFRSRVPFGPEAQLYSALYGVLLAVSAVGGVLADAGAAPAQEPQGQASAGLNWERPTELDGTAIPDGEIRGYQIWRKGSGSGQVLVQSIADPNTLSWDLSGLAAGSYELMVYVEWSDGSIDPLYSEYAVVEVA